MVTIQSHKTKNDAIMLFLWWIFYGNFFFPKLCIFVGTRQMGFLFPCIAAWLSIYSNRPRLEGTKQMVLVMESQKIIAYLSYG